MSELIPIDIASQDSALNVAWSDGHKSLYPFRDLRLACQCASCVDEWTRKPMLDPKSVPTNVRPVKADYVGRYAISFEWSDGHTTGIYTFDFLRALCPCPTCAKGS